MLDYFIRAAYDWRLNDDTGIGRMRTADEIRAALLEQFGDSDDDDTDARSDELLRHYCDVADPVVRARRVAQSFGLPWDEPFPSLFGEPVQLSRV